MKRRMFLALPAFAPAPAAAFRMEEADAALRADLAATCRAGADAHAELAALVEKAAADGTVPPERLRALATCPFCTCQVGWEGLWETDISGASR